MSRANHDIIHTLVKDDWCWWYRKYAPGDTVLEGLECDHKLLKFMELARGIEPPTCGLQNRCSAIELRQLPEFFCGVRVLPSCPFLVKCSGHVLLDIVQGLFALV